MAVGGWRSKQKVTAAGLNAMRGVQRVTGTHGINVTQTGDSVTIAPLDYRIIPSGVAGTSLREVGISKVVRCGKPSDDAEVEVCEDLEQTDHLRCYPIKADGLPDLTEPYTPVLPNFGHTVNEFAQVAWNINDLNQSVFTVFGGVRGLATMIFLEGLSLVPPPNPANICGEAAPTGACCDADGICIGNITQQACEDAGGVDFDSGAVCVVGNPCIGGDPTGVCCVVVNCSVVTEAECLANDGQWDGGNNSCAGDPCGGGPASGACCFNEPVPDTCAIKTPAECAALFGEYFGDGSPCTPGLCIGSQDEACCFADQTCQDLSGPTCLASGGTNMGPGSECATTKCPVLAGACCCDASVCGAECQCIEAVANQFECFNLTQGNGVFHPGFACAGIVCDTNC